MQRDGVRCPNNFVAELMNLKSLPPRICVDKAFTGPRNGWLLIRSKVIGSGKVWIGIDAGTQDEAVILYSGTTRETQEAMRFLQAGEHTITVWAARRSNCEEPCCPCHS